MANGCCSFLGYVAENFFSPLPDQHSEFFLGVSAVGCKFLRVIILEFAKRKATDIYNFINSFYDCRKMPEKTIHFINSFHITFCVWVEAEAGFLYGTFFPNAGQRILQLPSLGNMIVDIVCRDHGDFVI